MTTPHLKNPTVKTLLGVWALFLSFAFIQVGNGIQRVLLPVRGETEGFSPSIMGLVMAFHFSGYLFGAKFAPKSLATVGHIRVFSAMAHAGTPCPLNGKIGTEALEEWNKYDQQRPDYEEYVSALRYMEEVDNEILEGLDDKESYILDSNGEPTNILQ